MHQEDGDNLFFLRVPSLLFFPFLFGFGMVPDRATFIAHWAWAGHHLRPAGHGLAWPRQHSFRHEREQSAFTSAKERQASHHGVGGLRQSMAWRGVGGWVVPELEIRVDSTTGLDGWIVNGVGR
jgi:hypothetical protein